MLIFSVLFQIDLKDNVSKSFDEIRRIGEKLTKCPKALARSTYSSYNGLLCGVAFQPTDASGMIGDAIKSRSSRFLQR